MTRQGERGREGEREGERGGVRVFIMGRCVTFCDLQKVICDRNANDECIQCRHKLTDWSIMPAPSGSIFQSCLRPDLADGLFLTKAVARCIISAPRSEYVKTVSVHVKVCMYKTNEYPPNRVLSDRSKPDTKESSRGKEEFAQRLRSILQHCATLRSAKSTAHTSPAQC